MLASEFIEDLHVATHKITMGSVLLPHKIGDVPSLSSLSL